MIFSLPLSLRFISLSLCHFFFFSKFQFRLGCWGNINPARFCCVAALLRLRQLTPCVKTHQLLKRVLTGRKTDFYVFQKMGKGKKIQEEEEEEDEKEKGGKPWGKTTPQRRPPQRFLAATRPTTRTQMADRKRNQCAGPLPTVPFKLTRWR